MMPACYEKTTFVSHEHIPVIIRYQAKEIWQEQSDGSYHMVKGKQQYTTKTAQEALIWIMQSEPYDFNKFHLTYNII